MRIALLSDSHDNPRSIAWVIKYLNKHEIQLAFHAGDMVTPGIPRRFAEYFKGQLHYVFGNHEGEGYMHAKKEQEHNNLHCHNRFMDLSLEGRRMFMIHESYIGELVAQSHVFDLVVSGHDHTYRAKTFGKTLFINPGHLLLLDDWGKGTEDKENSFVLVDLSTMTHERIIVPKSYLTE